MLRKLPTVILVLLSATAWGQKYSLHYADTKTTASFRGLSVGKHGSVWVSGSKGTIGRSTNNGDSWAFTQVKGYEQCDFRTVYAFDSANALIANAGSPAYILRTTDGGRSWQKMYENKDTAAFIDGMDFWNGKKGIVHGDPINGHMLLLYTRDGGKTWQPRKEQSRPLLNKGEASFAASGTAISCLSGRSIVIATGGSTARLLYSCNRGKKWRAIPTPMLCGTPGAGIFSFMASPTSDQWLIAGGDYQHDTITRNNFFYSSDKGKTWQAPQTTTRGYRECLAVRINFSGREPSHPTATYFAVGPGGIDVSIPGGWRALSDDKGFHVIKTGYYPRLFLAGANGKVAVMEVE